VQKQINNNTGLAKKQKGKNHWIFLLSKTSFWRIFISSYDRFD